MLRLLFVALVVANIGYFAWARGEAGKAEAAGDREPQRVAQQIRPQLLQIRPAGAMVAAPAPAPAPAPAVTVAAPASVSTAVPGSGPGPVEALAPVAADGSGPR